MQLMWLKILADYQGFSTTLDFFMVEGSQSKLKKNIIRYDFLNSLRNVLFSF